MSTEDEMTIDERYKYLRCMKKRYRQANREGRGRLLDEMQAVTGLHRKSLIRLINGPLTRKPRRRQRGSTYGPDVESALCIIAESLDYICAERLTPNLVSVAQHLDAHGELRLSPSLLDKLERISASTVRRIPSRHRPDICRPVPHSSHIDCHSYSSSCLTTMGQGRGASFTNRRYRMALGGSRRRSTSQAPGPSMRVNSSHLSPSAEESSRPSSTHPAGQ